MGLSQASRMASKPRADNLRVRFGGAESIQSKQSSGIGFFARGHCLFRSSGVPLGVAWRMDLYTGKAV